MYYTYKDDILRIMAEGEGDFDFDQWAEKAELTRKTVKYLRSEELMTVRTLSLINEKDIVMMPLPLGQRKLLIASARELVGDSSHPVLPPSVIHTPTIPEHPDGTRDNTGLHRSRLTHVMWQVRRRILRQ